MNMKTRFIIVLSIIFMVSSAFAGEKGFGKGQLFVTPQVAYYSYAPNFGASLEYGLTEKIGIGGSLMLAFWNTGGGPSRVSESLIVPSFDTYYHLKQIAAEKFDFFVGLSVGYSIYSWSWDMGDFNWGDAGSSSLYLSPIAGGRYYITQKLAISLRTHYSALGDWTGLGGVLGITFRLSK